MSLHFENGIVAASSIDEIISDDLITTGAVHWVDSVNGNDSNPGTEKLPLATLTQAVANATASNGDIVVVKAGSSFSLGSNLSLSKAGVKYFGLGSGSSKPSITVTGSGIDGVSLDAGGVEFNNFRFPIGTTNTNTARIDIDAAVCVVKNCDFLCGLRDPDTITITANGIGTIIENCTFTVSADGPDSGIVVEDASATGIKISNCSFNGGSYGWDNGAIYSASAHTDFIYKDNTLTSDSSIVHTDAATGICSGTIAGDGCHVRI